MVYIGWVNIGQHLYAFLICMTGWFQLEQFMILVILATSYSHLAVIYYWAVSIVVA